MSIGIKLGRAIGTVGAYALEGAVRGAQGAGTFAQEVAHGAEVGYVEAHERLVAQRAERAAKNAAQLAEIKAQLVSRVEPPPASVMVKRGKVAL